MILAAGLTPAWQQVLSFECFKPGDVNRATSASWCASGKVLNVGCALHQLGCAAKSLCLIGGASGQQIRADFEHLGVAVRWVDSEIPTRICTTIVDSADGTTTELVENSGTIPGSEVQKFRDAFEEESAAATVVVFSGSLPAGVPANYVRELLEPLSAKIVLDIRGPELEEALVMRPFVVKPNREELAKTVRRNLESEADLVSAMEEIRTRGAEWVVVSQGPAPLLALGPAGLIRVSPPQVPVKNPIGCGDCLAAGIAAGIDRQFSMRKALEIGVRAAAENAQELLPARRLSRLP